MLNKEVNIIFVNKENRLEPRKYRSGSHLFFSFFWKYPVPIIVSMLLNIITSILRVYPAVLVGLSLDALIEYGFSTQFIYIALMLILVGLLSYGLTFIANYVYVITAFKFERDIRQEFFDTIQNHSLTFHDENNSSKLLAMGMTEISQIRIGLMPSMRAIIQSIFSIIFVVVYITPKIGNVYILSFGFLLYYVLAYRYARKITSIRMQLANAIGRVTESSQEIFRGIEVVRAMAAKDREVHKFNEASGEYAYLANKEGKLGAFYLPTLVLIALTVFSFYIAIEKAVVGELTIGDVIQVVGLLLGLQFYNLSLPNFLLNVQAALTNSGRIWEKLNWVDPYPEAETAPRDINWDGAIDFKNVSFYYADRLVLDKITTHIEPHSKVAIIGGPGSGKSTFLKLLLQLYLPHSGHILIDGVDIAKIPSKEVRKHVARVEQDVFLFSGTIRDNIAFTNPNASDEEVIAAAKAAQAYEFIEKMPKKLNTVIGERGVTLSGGQKQRIAIARAILANPNILLLDDSSSALDSKTELLIRTALDNLSSGRLVFTVTQRLNTLVKADKILLFQKGKIHAEGTHEELLSSCKEYQKIFELLPEAERLIKGGNN